MLIITGTVAYDHIMNFPGEFSDHVLAGKEHSINLSFIVNKFERRRGGTAGNVSYGLGLMGIDHILLSSAGKDFEEYQNEFQKLGINTKHILIDKEEYTATGFAMTDKKDNQIWGYFYGAAESIKKLNLQKIAKKTDLVLIGPSGTEGSMTFVKQCIKLEIPYMFDPGFILTQISTKDLKLGVENAAYLIGNDYEIHLIQNKIKNFDTIVKPKTLITTLGAKGAIIQKAGKKYKIPPVRVKNDTDPTGAGDSWRAGFLAGLVRNYDLQTCGQIGSLLAAYTVEQYGTQEHKFTKKQFTKRYKDAYNTEVKL
jgi:adenosine kinase